MRACIVIALICLLGGTARAACCGDCDGDGQVQISELIQAVNAALGGCATPTDAPPTNTATTPATSTPGPARFVDNADGTVTDTMTGLMWEKKAALDSAVNAANLHDADNPYSWSGLCSMLTTKRCQPNAAAATTCAARLMATGPGAPSV